MNEDQFKLLVGLGIAMFAIGLWMPAEFSETLYRGGEVIDRTYENNFKYPTIVVGAAMTLMAFVLRE